MHVYTCVYVRVCIFVNRLWVSVAVLQRVWMVSCMRMCIRVDMYAYAYVCMYIHIYVHFFAVNVACTLELVFWAPVHLYTLYRCSFDITVHICDTFAAGCAHMCICIYMCICMHVYMDAYMRLWYCLTRWGVVAEIFCLCIDVRVDVYVYVCACMRVYVHVHMYVYVYMCVCVYVRKYMYKHTRAGVHMHSCRRIWFICIVQSLYYMRVYHRCFSTLSCVCGGGLEVGIFSSLFMVSACCWRGRLCFDRGRDRGFVWYISLFSRLLG